MGGAALRVYAESGEQGLTVSAVTKDSGVSLGSLYHHFGSIDGLVIAAERRWVGRLLDELLTALQAAPTSRDGSEAVVRAYFAFVREHPDAAWLVHIRRRPADAERRGVARRPASEGVGPRPMCGGGSRTSPDQATPAVPYVSGVLQVVPPAAEDVHPGVIRPSRHRPEGHVFLTGLDRTLGATASARLTPRRLHSAHPERIYPWIAGHS
ncbi:TetR/AcrR family transcriptional regulator [Streptomyces sp. NPDC002523]